MIIRNTHIAQLIALFLLENISDTELKELEKWRATSSENEELFQHIIKEKNISCYLQKYASVDTSKAWKGFKIKQKRKIQNRWRKKAFIYASSLLIPIAILSVYLINSSEYFSANQELYLAEKITPGETKAILTPALSNKTIQLTEVDSLNLKEDSKLLTSHLGSTTKSTKEVEIEELNTIEIPRGGEYTLTLSDGTIVFLNSMSKLTFPTQFIGNERKVLLEGEAFFDVKESDAPFIVTAQGVNVTVLGTQFNISAYVGESYEATLLTGKIALHTPTSNKTLKPHQKASIQLNSDKIEVEEVDALSISEWHKGKIVFKNQSLEYIMKRLARWYDFDVVYDNTSVGKLRFSCAIDKYEDITPFIKLLQSTGRVNYEIENIKTIHLK